MLELRWGGETVVVLAERALWWARRETLCIADVHLGKGAAFRQAGVPVPEAATGADLTRLDGVVRRFGPRRLVILGDLLHARTGRCAETMDAFGAWRGANAALDVLLVRGNHDESSGDPPADWRVRVRDEPWADEGDGEIVFSHYPEPRGRAAAGGKVLCGHIHPAVSLSGAVTGLRAPCFWFGPRVGVLPAFGSFTGMKVILPGAADRVFALGPEEVMDVNPRAAGMSGRVRPGGALRPAERRSA